jgi:hypothetical protein
MRLYGGAEGLWLFTFLPSRGVDCKPHNPFSPTHTDKLTQDTGSFARQRLNAQQQQAGRVQRSKMAEGSQEDERAVKENRNVKSGTQYPGGDVELGMNNTKCM